MATNSEVPVALTIAGSDSSAGAGAQADLKTFTALGVYGLTAITCVVAETPGKVSRIDAVDPEMVAEQIDVLLRSFPIAAIKTGLLHSGTVVSLVAARLRAHRASAGKSVVLIVDPVMIATSGDRLLQADAVAAYERELFPLASLLTPNLDEAATLLGEQIADLPAMRRAGEKLAQKYGVPILLKGGHLTGNIAIDLLFTGDRMVEFSAPFSRGIATHGTGCTYSAAITAGLASGFELEGAVKRAKDFVTAAISRHFKWTMTDGSQIHALNQSPR